MNVDSNDVEALLTSFETELIDRKGIYGRSQRLQTIIELRIRFRHMVSQLTSETLKASSEEKSSTFEKVYPR